MKRTNRTRRRRKAGFTLIELLVTTVLIGIIGITTFAILISSLNTFGKQNDAVSALQLKDLVVESVRNEIAKSMKVVTVDSFLEGPQIKVMVKDDTAINGEREEIRPEVIAYPDVAQPYLRDNKVTDYGFIYSYEGRVYYVESNINGRVNYDLVTRMPTSYPTPPSGIMYGNAMPLLDEQIYGKYMVDIAFKPIFTETVEVTLEDMSEEMQNRYYTIQVIVTVTHKDKPSEVITRGVETIELDNVRHGKRGILFRNNPTIDWKPTDTAKEGTFKYCYYTKLPSKPNTDQDREEVLLPDHP